VLFAIGPTHFNKLTDKTSIRWTTGQAKQEHGGQTNQQADLLPQSVFEIIIGGGNCLW